MSLSSAPRAERGISARNLTTSILGVVAGVVTLVAACLGFWVNAKSVAAEELQEDVSVLAAEKAKLKTRAARDAGMIEAKNEVIAEQDSEIDELRGPRYSTVKIEQMTSESVVLAITVWEFG